MTKYILYLFISIILSIEVFAGGFIAKNSEKKIKAIKLSEKIKIDGALNENIWSSIPVSDFTQRDPEEGKPATEKTNVWVAYDETHLYVGGKLYDSKPDQIDKALFRRDTWTMSDWMYVYFDPYNDKRTGYFFAVNAGGSMSDGTLFNDSWDDDSWDGIWEAASTVEEDGWSFEMKIPFSQLRFNETKEMKWGVNFNRDIKRKNESSFFVMIPKDESGFVSHFATLEGLNGIKAKQRFEALPYLVQKAQYLVHDPDDPYYKQNQYETNIGGDFKIGLGSNFTIDATVNPDFGQVEADPAVVNLSAFETFYHEKRPFFIEGSSIFNYGYGGSNNNWGFNFGVPELFYSRRIGRSPQGSTSDYQFVDYPTETPIIAAGKLTGKVANGWSLGALSSVTARSYAKLYNDGSHTEEEVEPLTHYGVMRSQKEFNEGRQALGMIFTTTNRNLRNDELKNSLVKDAFAFGLDGWTFLDENKEYVVTGLASVSHVSGSQEALQNVQEKSYRYFQRPDSDYYDSTRTSLTGYYGRVMLNKQDGNFYINSALGVVSPGFEYNDLGFQWNSDKFNGHIVTGYKWHQPDNIFRRKRIYLAHYRDYNFEGDNLRNGFMLFANGQFLNYYGFDINANINLEAYNRSLTRGGPIVKDPEYYSFRINGYSDHREKIIYWGGYSRSGDDLGSYRNSAWVGVEWKPISQINLSIEPEYTFNNNTRQWIDNVDDEYAVNTYDNRYVFGKIEQKTISAEIRLNWTFTPKLTLQLYMQPLISVGSYNEFKELAKSRSLDYSIYGKNGSTVEYIKEDNEYEIDPDGAGGPAKPFRIDNPDFNFKSLRGTLVLRYEVLPGSIFYLVWSHDKTDDKYPGELDVSRDFRTLWNSRANNIFMLKFSYWFDV